MRDQKIWKDLEDELNLSVPLVDPPASLEARIMQKVALKKKSRPLAFRPWIVWAAAALLLAVGNLGQWAASQSYPSLQRPGLKVVMLSGSQQSEAYGTIVLDTDDNHGILAVRDLPQPGLNGQYQLWLWKEKNWKSAGVFDVNSDGYGAMMVTLPAKLEGFHDFCITLETKGGSEWPTAKPIVSGRF